MCSAQLNITASYGPDVSDGGGLGAAVEEVLHDVREVVHVGRGHAEGH